MATSPFLPHLPVDKIETAYRRAAGKELETGKLSSPESSAALVANTFGLFIDRAEELPPLPGVGHLGWPARRLSLEQQVRFPWRGGRHPWLDVLIETDSHVIGIESKRFEPFRGEKEARFSDAYLRDLWGRRMKQFEALRDALREGTADLAPLDAVQLVKHALGLRTEAVLRRQPPKQPVLVYLYAEPRHWPDGRVISGEQRREHAKAAQRFAEVVAGAEVEFCTLTYRQLFDAWQMSGSERVRRHAAAVAERFPDL